MMIRRPWNKKFLLTACLVFSAACISLAADSSHKISNYEKVVFSLFKFNGGTPNYKKIIEQIDRYRTEQSSFIKNKVYEEENLRLKWGFNAFNPETDYITIETDIFVQLTLDFKVPMLNFRFLHAEQDQVPYFPYPYDYELIAVAANDLKKFQYLPLNEDRYNQARSVFALKKLYDAKMTLQVKPLSVKEERPESDESLKQWIITSDIASIRFTYYDPDQGEILLGAYKAPWYGEQKKVESALDTLVTEN